MHSHVPGRPLLLTYPTRTIALLTPPRVHACHTLHGPSHVLVAGVMASERPPPRAALGAAPTRQPLSAAPSSAQTAARPPPMAAARRPTSAPLPLPPLPPSPTSSALVETGCARYAAHPYLAPTPLAQPPKSQESLPNTAPAVALPPQPHPQPTHSSLSPTNRAYACAQVAEGRRTRRSARSLGRPQPRSGALSQRWRRPQARGGRPRAPHRSRACGRRGRVTRSGRGAFWMAAGTSRARLSVGLSGRASPRGGARV